jgi:hypothetical protein
LPKKRTQTKKRRSQASTLVTPKPKRTKSITPQPAHPATPVLTSPVDPAALAALSKGTGSFFSPAPRSGIQLSILDAKTRLPFTLPLTPSQEDSTTGHQPPSAAAAHLTELRELGGDLEVLTTPVGVSPTSRRDSLLQSSLDGADDGRALNGHAHIVPQKAGSDAQARLDIRLLTNGHDIAQLTEVKNVVDPINSPGAISSHYSRLQADPEGRIGRYILPQLFDFDSPTADGTTEVDVLENGEPGVSNLPTKLSVVPNTSGRKGLAVTLTEEKEPAVTPTIQRTGLGGRISPTMPDLNSPNAAFSEFLAFLRSPSNTTPGSPQRIVLSAEDSLGAQPVSGSKQPTLLPFGMSHAISALGGKSSLVANLLALVPNNEDGGSSSTELPASSASATGTRETASEANVTDPSRRIRSSGDETAETPAALRTQQATVPSRRPPQHQRAP